MTEERFDPEEVAQFENATWSRGVDTYMDGFGALVREAIGPLLDEVTISEGDRVLDVGTGPGLVAAAAAERGADVVDIDFSEAMVAKARQLHPDMEFQRAHAESLPSDDGRFDAVVGNFVLRHSGQPDEVLREAFRVLRQGGRVGFTVWADLSKLEAFGLFFAAVEEHAGSAELPHGPLFGVSDFDVFHRMVRSAGFRDSSVRELPIAWRTASLDSYGASFRDWANLDAFPQTSWRSDRSHCSGESRNVPVRKCVRHAEPSDSRVRREVRRPRRLTPLRIPLSSAPCCRQTSLPRDDPVVATVNAPAWLSSQRMLPTWPLGYPALRHTFRS